MRVEIGQAASLFVVVLDASEVKGVAWCAADCSERVLHLEYRGKNREVSRLDFSQPKLNADKDQHWLLERRP